MKRFTILMTLALAIGSFANAQKLTVTTSSVSNKPLSFDAADPASGWGNVAITLTYSNVAIELVDDGSANPTLGCNTLVNTTMATKAALVYRGSCEFGSKAYNAQVAGAAIVLIVNNDPLGTAGMSGGTNGPNVNVPVIMISKADGDLIKADLAAGGSPVINLTPWSWGYDYDLGMLAEQQIKPYNLTQPSFLLTEALNLGAAGDYYNKHKAAHFATNYSNLRFDTISHSAGIFQGATAVWTKAEGFYDTTGYLPTDTELNHLFSDSFDLSSLAPGQYQIVNQIDVLQAGGDGYPSDNSVSANFTITDSLYARTSMMADMVTPNIQQTYAPGASIEWGPMLHFPIAQNTPKKVKIDKIRLPVFLRANSGKTDLDGEKFDINIYKWVDANGDSSVELGELTPNLEASMSYTFTPGSIVADSTRCLMTEVQVLDVDANSGLIVDPFSIYWIDVKMDGPNAGYAMDQDAQNNNRLRYFYFSSQNPNPYAGTLMNCLISGGTLYSGFAGSGPPIVMAVLSIVDSSTAINEVSDAFGMKTYPNPAQDHVTVSVNSKKGIQDYITLVMSDMTGRIIQTKTTSKTASVDFNVDLTDVTPGSYILKVMTPEGFNTQKLIKK